MTAPWAIPNRAWAVGIVWAQSSFGAGSRYPSCAAPLIFGMPISSCGAFQRCLGHGNRRGAICSLNTAGEFSCAHYDPGFQVCCCWNWAGVSPVCLSNLGCGQAQACMGGIRSCLGADCDCCLSLPGNVCCGAQRRACEVCTSMFADRCRCPLTRRCILVFCRCALRYCRLWCARITYEGANACARSARRPVRGKHPRYVGDYRDPGHSPRAGLVDINECPSWFSKRFGASIPL